MKVIEILKLGRNILEVLQEACVKVDDVRYIALYEEYRDIVGNGGKATYAVCCLAEKYGISERQVYYVIRKLGKSCNIGAAE